MSNFITIKLRRGTAAQWAATNPVLAEGEVGLETDTRKFKVGTGAAAWNSMQYWGGSGGGAADFIDLGDVPPSYSGQAGKYVKVNGTADGLEFGTLTIAAGDLPSGIDAAKIANGTVSNTEFQYLDGVTSAIQTQLNGKAPLVHTHIAADIINIGHHKIIGRHGAGTGEGQEIGIDGGLEFQGANIRRAALTGDVTASAGDNTTTISNGAVTNDKIASGIDAVKLADGSVSNTEFQTLNGVTSAIQTQLDGKVDENAAITGATKTKITYDAKGLVTAGADATTADIADSLNKRYVTDADLTKLSNTSGTNTGDQTITLTGDVTGTGTSSFAATIANNSVTLAKIQDITTARILGRVTAGSGDPEELTGTQATTLLDTFTSSLKGLAPASGGGTSNFLRADGTWAAPAGGGGGDVTVLDIDNATNGPVNTTTETAIYSYTLPTDLAAGEVLQLTICGSYQNTVSARTFTNRIKIGGTTILSHAPSVGASASVRYWSATLLIYIENPANLQRLSYLGFVANAASGSLTNAAGLTTTPWNGNGLGEGTIDLTSAKTLELTTEISAASLNAYCHAESAQLIRYAAP